MASTHFATQATLSAPASLSSASVPLPLPLPLPADASPSPLKWFLVSVINTADTEDNLARWSSFIGIVVAICGNILISLALNVQKYAHVRLERESEQRRRWRRQRRPARRKCPPASSSASSPPASLSASSEETESLPLLRPEKDLDIDGADRKYISSPYWWCGLVMMFVGECGNFLAYGFAPASIVSPLGVVALVSNCVIAPLMLKEPFRGRDFVGVLVSIMGAVTVVWSAAKEETKFGPDEILHAISQTAFIVYFSITVTLIVVLIPLSSKYGQRSIVIDLGLVALLGGYTVLSTKGISSLISSSLYHIFAYPVAYLFAFILATTAVAQIKYLNRALQRFDSTQVIPTQFVLFTLSVIVGSAILYRDFETVGRQQMLKFVFGCLLTFLGVYLISSERDTDHSVALGKDDPEHHMRSLDDGVDSESDSDAEDETLPPPPQRRDSPELTFTVVSDGAQRPTIANHTTSTVPSKAVSEQSLQSLATSHPPRNTSSSASLSRTPPANSHLAHGPPPPETPQSRGRVPSAENSPHTTPGSESRKRSSISGLMPGVMAGYQLHSVLGESFRLHKSKSGEFRDHGNSGAGQGSEGAGTSSGGRGRGRSGSISLMLGRLKGAWKRDDEAPWEQEEAESRPEAAAGGSASGSAPPMRARRSGSFSAARARRSSVALTVEEEPRSPGEQQPPQEEQHGPQERRGSGSD